eukprot:10990523-Lingulodinium_polyedra.AAC.1
MPDGCAARAPGVWRGPCTRPDAAQCVESRCHGRRIGRRFGRGFFGASVVSWRRRFVLRRVLVGELAF